MIEMHMALDEVADAVRQLGSRATARDVAEHLGISHVVARVRLQRAARKGLVVRIDWGRYRAPVVVQQSDKDPLGRSWTGFVGRIGGLGI